MSNVLVVYGSRYGHAQRIAGTLAGIAETRGHQVQVADAAHAPEVGAFDIVVVCASIHMGHHPREVERFARAQGAALARRRTLFVSVGLSATEPPGTQAHTDAERCVASFVERTGWLPDRIELVAGGLAYTKYGWLTRMVMKSMARSLDKPTDTTRDHDFTDWQEVARLGEEMFPDLRVAPMFVAPEPAREAAALAPA